MKIHSNDECGLLPNESNKEKKGGGCLGAIIQALIELLGLNLKTKQLQRKLELMTQKIESSREEEDKHLQIHLRNGLVFKNSRQALQVFQYIVAKAQESQKLIKSIVFRQGRYQEEAHYRIEEIPGMNANILQEIFRLFPDLTHLDLGYTCLHKVQGINVNTITEVFSSLTNLTHLDLGYTCLHKIQGINVNTIREIFSSLTNLTHLDLGYTCLHKIKGNKLKGINVNTIREIFSSLTNLTHLDLGESTIKYIIAFGFKDNPQDIKCLLRSCNKLKYLNRGTIYRGYLNRPTKPKKLEFFEALGEMHSGLNHLEKLYLGNMLSDCKLPEILLFFEALGPNRIKHLDPGISTKIRNYYHNRPKNDDNAKKCQFGYADPENTFEKYIKLFSLLPYIEFVGNLYERKLRRNFFKKYDFENLAGYNQTIEKINQGYKKLLSYKEKERGRLINKIKQEVQYIVNGGNELEAQKKVQLIMQGIQRHIQIQNKSKNMAQEYIIRRINFHAGNMPNNCDDMKCYLKRSLKKCKENFAELRYYCMLGRIFMNIADGKYDDLTVDN